MSRRFTLAACFVLFAISWATELPAQPTLHLDADGTEVRVESLEPGGGAVLLAVHRRVENYVTVAGGLREVLNDDAADGRVAMTLDQPVPLASIWIAVDLTSGETTVEWPEGFEARELGASSLRLLQGTDEAAGDTLVTAGRILEVFLVRPGEAPQVWHRTLANGGPADVEPDPTSMALSLGALESLTSGEQEASPAPDTVQPTDLVILLDPTRLRWQIVEGEALSSSLPGSSGKTAEAGTEDEVAEEVAR